MARNNEAKTLQNKIRKLAPDAIDAMGEMLRAPNTPAPTKAQLIGYILERTLGKPDTTIHLTTAGGTVRDSEDNLISVVKGIQERMMRDPEGEPDPDNAAGGGYDPDDNCEQEEDAEEEDDEEDEEYTEE